MNLPNGTLLQGGTYKIVRFISSGGFGCTYEAVNTRLGGRIAIKESFIQSLCVRDSNTAYIQVTTPANDKNVQILKEKFIKEARILGQFNHPNIVRVSDIFQENNTAYYVMDFIEGQSLAQIVDQYGPLSETEAIRYIRQVADALRYVHAHDYLHLDIKPGNIMVDKSRKAILIDFGASKHYDSESGENTTAFKSIRSEGYAPTEQTAGFVKFSPPTDIYALGATLYKLLTGERPAEAQLLMMGEVKLKPLPSTVSQTTKNAIERAMRPRRTDRPQSVDEFLSLFDPNNPKNQSFEKTTSNRSTSPGNNTSQQHVRPEEAIDVTLVDGNFNSVNQNTPKRKNDENVPRPNNYLIWAILSTILCCLPLGIVSIYYSTKSNSYWDVGKKSQSQNAARKAKKWAIASAIVGSIFIIIYLVINYVVSEIENALMF